MAILKNVGWYSDHARAGFFISNFDIKETSIDFSYFYDFGLQLA